ncbi:MAG: hypothetical protein LBF15_03235 [Candidatus Peribacteria bacterium]|jgi:hypothetical protein|nr:hypothetical protein [Candidatus Peribacteria bacterium]
MKLLNFIKKADQENGIEKIYVEDFIELKGILYKNNLVHEIYNNFASLLEATNKVKQVRESN